MTHWSTLSRRRNITGTQRFGSEGIKHPGLSYIVGNKNHSHIKNRGSSKLIYTYLNKNIAQTQENTNSLPEKYLEFNNKSLIITENQPTNPGENSTYNIDLVNNYSSIQTEIIKLRLILSKNNIVYGNEEINYVQDNNEYIFDVKNDTTEIEIGKYMFHLELILLNNITLKTSQVEMNYNRYIDNVYINTARIIPKYLKYRELLLGNFSSKNIIQQETMIAQTDNNLDDLLRVKKITYSMFDDENNVILDNQEIDVESNQVKIILTQDSDIERPAVTQTNPILVGGSSYTQYGIKYDPARIEQLPDTAFKTPASIPEDLKYKDINGNVKYNDALLSGSRYLSELDNIYYHNTSNFYGQVFTAYQPFCFKSIDLYPEVGTSWNDLLNCVIYTTKLELNNNFKDKSFNKTPQEYHNMNGQSLGDVNTYNFNDFIDVRDNVPTDLYKFHKNIYRTYITRSILGDRVDKIVKDGEKLTLPISFDIAYNVVNLPLEAGIYGIFLSGKLQRNLLRTNYIQNKDDLKLSSNVYMNSIACFYFDTLSDFNNPSIAVHKGYGFSFNPIIEEIKTFIFIEDTHAINMEEQIIEPATTNKSYHIKLHNMLIEHKNADGLYNQLIYNSNHINQTEFDLGLNPSILNINTDYLRSNNPDAPNIDGTYKFIIYVQDNYAQINSVSITLITSPFMNDIINLSFSDKTEGVTVIYPEESKIIGDVNTNTIKELTVYISNPNIKEKIDIINKYDLTSHFTIIIKNESGVAIRSFTYYFNMANIMKLNVDVINIHNEYEYVDLIVSSLEDSLNNIYYSGYEDVNNYLNNKVNQINNNIKNELKIYSALLYTLGEFDTQTKLLGDSTLDSIEIINNPGDTSYVKIRIYLTRGYNIPFTNNSNPIKEINLYSS